MPAGPVRSRRHNDWRILRRIDRRPDLQDGSTNIRRPEDDVIVGLQGDRLTQIIGGLRHVVELFVAQGVRFLCHTSSQYTTSRGGSSERAPVLCTTSKGGHIRTHPGTRLCSKRRSLGRRVPCPADLSDEGRQDASSKTTRTGPVITRSYPKSSGSSGGAGPRDKDSEQKDCVNRF